ncbi:hypothetical protein DFH09DRAFT_1075207 [Mycena vulgaris]|nr:hypothetical protein DFH09DRAFT_1075207 [Mycena vulgaris]
MTKRTKTGPPLFYLVRKSGTRNTSMLLDDGFRLERLSLDSISFKARSFENKWIMGKPAIVAGVPDGKSAGDYVSIYAPVVGRGEMYKVFRLATLKTGASSQRGFQAPLRQLPAAGPDPGGFPGFFNIHTFTIV